MNYHHLHYFWKVAKLGGMARAAAELKLTQPTISEQVRLLEQSIGHKLFRRVGRSLVLTEVGQAVFEKAERIFELGDELSQSLKGQRFARTLRVGVDPAIPAMLVAHALRKHKDDVLEVVYARTERVLENTRLDLALTPIRPRRNDQPILDLPTVFVSKSGAKLASQRVLLPSSVPHEDLQRFIRAQKIEAGIVSHFASVDLALMFAREGHGACAAPDCKPLYAGLKVVGHTKAVRWQVYAIDNGRATESSNAIG